MRESSKKNWFLVLVGLCIAGLLISTVLSLRSFAQTPDSVTLAISPQLLELTANRGDVLSNTFRLSNGSDTPIQIQTIPKNFIPLGEEGAVDLTEDKTTYSLAEWLTVMPDSATLNPGETRDFVVTTRIPANAEPGSHFGSVVFQTVPDEQAGTAALVSQEIAPVILVRIAGDTTETAEIEEFRSALSFYSNQNSIDLLTRIRNTGNVHFKPSGKIIIKNMWGSEVAEIELDQRNVLPESIRQITSSWEPEGFTIGRYSATVTIVFGEDNEIRTTQTSFVVFPYQTLLPIAILVSIVGFVVYKGRARIIKALRVLSGKEESKDS